MKIYLFDFNTKGHHLTYLKHFAKALIELNIQFTIITPVDDNETFIELKKFNIEFITIKDLPHKPNKSNFFTTRKYVKSYWKISASILEKTNINITKDLVFFTSLDEYLSSYITIYEIDKIFKYNWSGLYLKPRYLRIKQNYSLVRKGIFNLNYLLKSKNCKGFSVLDESIIERLFYITKNKNIQFLPDIISDDEPNIVFQEYQQIEKLANGRIIILLIGAIDKRKGLINLIELSNILNKSKYYFVIAGEIYLDTFTPKEELSLKNLMNQNDNLYFYNKQIPNEAIFNAFIKLCDILYASYIDFPYSSNMIGKAAYFKKPIIVSNNYLMSDIVLKYNLGLSIKQNNINDLKIAIEKLTSNYAYNEISNEHYKTKYSFENFKHNLNILIS
jgi:glycosyltransferase involved in cell wall biosynthesis